MHQYITIQHSSCRFSQIDFPRKRINKSFQCSRYIQLHEIQEHQRICLPWVRKWRPTKSNTLGKYAEKSPPSASNFHHTTLRVLEPRGTIDSFTPLTKQFKVRASWAILIFKMDDCWILKLEGSMRIVAEQSNWNDWRLSWKQDWRMESTYAAPLYQILPHGTFILIKEQHNLIKVMLYY